MRRAHPAWRIRIALLTLALVSMGLVGCGPQVTRDQVMSYYQLGDYAKAYSGAAELTAHGDAASKQEMAYVAGMSAYRTDRSADAIRYLTPLADHPNRQIAGPSCATLGLIHTERGQYEQALSYFNKAVPKLDGENLAQAHYYIGITQQKLGRPADGVAELRLASRMTGDAALKEAIRQRLATTGFTLQFGAYNEPRNAEERASVLRKAITAAGLGEPRVVYLATPKGKLYLVQAGQFDNADLANRVKTRLGRTDVVVTAIQTK